MSVKNPNKNDEAVLREPKDILDEIKELDSESEEIFKNINKINLKLYENRFNKKAV